MRITNLRINHMVNPVGFLFDKTVFSYQIIEAIGKKQKSAQIRVATDADMKNIIADTGLRGDTSSLATELKVTLSPRSRYYWDVKVVSDAGEEAVSEVAFFETAKMNEAWAGKWIASDRGKDAKTGRQPRFVKTFELAKEVQSSRLYITGLGLYNAVINGKLVSEEKLTPFCNDYNDWVQYQTFDVTALLSAENHMSVTMGDGWYKGRFGFVSKPDGSGFYGDDYKMIMELHIIYTDGSEEVVVSDESWKVERSEFTFSNIYDGERRDDTLDALPLEDVVVIDSSYAINEEEYKLCDNLVERMSIPLLAHEELKPIELINTPAGEKVFDLGQNMAGGFRLHVNASRGTEIHVQVGEVLQQGNFYNDNLRSAKAEYIYISDGTKKDIEPVFTFYGYRYAKVEGLENLTIDDFTAIAYYSDFTPVGEIETGHEKLNQLISNVKWGQKGNFIDVPTDCPQRDERMGWTADTQVFVPTASYFTDSYAFYRKYLYDLRKEQLNFDGGIPDVVPSAGVDASCSSVWGDATTIIPWTLYEYSGDKSILEESVDSMAAWVDKVCRIDGENHGYRDIFHYGDWLALDNPKLHKDTTAGGTEEGYIGDVYHMYSAELVAKAAEIIGRTDMAKKYEVLAAKLRKDIQAEYFTATGRCAITTMTGYILALRHDLTTDREAVGKQLVKLLAAKGNKLQTGFVGTPFLCQELSKIGQDRIAYEVLLNEEYPGWLYEINLGATTVWERWNSMEADGSVSSTGMNSFNHYAYGSIAEWMWKTIGGINFAEPGFKKAHIRMIPNLKVKSAKASYNSVAGRYSTSWEVIDDTHVKMHVEIPFDCTAVIELFDPMNSENKLNVAAGAYDFEYELAHSLRNQYTVDTPLKVIFEDEEAMKLIEENMPELLRVSLHMQIKSIREIKELEYGPMSKEVADKINAMLKCPH